MSGQRSGLGGCESALRTPPIFCAVFVANMLVLDVELLSVLDHCVAGWCSST